MQFLRALAALLVVWAHAIDLASVRQLPAWQIDYGFLQNFGAVGVDIFFVISGFIVTISAQRSGSAGRFLWHRALRIWPLYALATLLMFGLWPWSEARLLQLPWSLLLMQQPGRPMDLPVHPLGWSLFFEAAFYLVLACAMRWRSPRPLGERVLIVLMGLICLGSMERFAQPLNIIGNPMVLEFCFGVWIAMARGARPRLPAWCVSALFVVGAVLLLKTALYGFGDISEAPFVLNTSASWQRVRDWGLPSALLVASAVWRPAPPARFSVGGFLGDASYSIYLFSYPALWFMDRLWPSELPIGVDAMILVAAGAAVAVGVLAYGLVERPLMRALARWR